MLRLLHSTPGVSSPWPFLHGATAAASAAAGYRGPAEFDGAAFAPRHLRAGQKAFLQGQQFAHLDSVRTGSFKIAVVLTDGREQVSRFCFTGDVMGLDGVGSGVHASTATALEDSIVHPVPVTSLQDAAVRGNAWHDVLCRHMGQEIARNHERMLLLGTTTAFTRLATFLLEVSERMRVRGYSPLDLNLRMSRADIGSYLGLRLETVSRLLSTLQQQGVVTVDKRHIVIRALAPLQQLRDAQDA